MPVGLCGVLINNSLVRGLIAARSVANSPLVKTAICGADPNWGRIMMALGKSTAKVAADFSLLAAGNCFGPIDLNGSDVLKAAFLKHPP